MLSSRRKRTPNSACRDSASYRTTSRPLHFVGPSGPNVLTSTWPPGFTARHLANVRDTLVHCRKEMKHGAVVPHIVGVGREVALDNVRRDPLNSFRSRTQTLFGYVDGSLRNIKDGDVLISMAEEVIHQC